MSDAAFVINGKTYPIPTELNLGELAEIEGITGQGYDLSKPGAKGTLALAFIAVKRIDPTVTLSDLETLALDDLGVEGGEVIVPLAPAGASSASAAPSTGTSEPGSDAPQDATPVSSGTSA